MKKILICVLAIVMVISMAIPAVAFAKTSALWETRVPVLVKESTEDAVIYSAEEAMELTEEIQDLMLEAKAKLKKACPKGFGIHYFSYADVIDDKESVTLTFEPIDHYDIAFMQYIDGTWVVVKHTVNAGATITVEVVAEAPLAVFISEVFAAPDNGASFASAAAKKAKLLPALAQGSSETVLLHSTEDVLKLTEEIQSQMVEAKAQLKDTCPEDFAAKYFCYAEILGSDGSASAVLKSFKHEEIQCKQYVNGAWVERKVTSEDAGITVAGITDAPLALFVK